MSSYNEIDFDDENDGFSNTINNHSAGNDGNDKPAPPPLPPQLQNFNSQLNQNNQNSQSNNAMTAICIHKLDWSTTEEQVRELAAECGLEEQIKLVVFDEYRLNGKSRGNVYLEMASVEATTQFQEFIASIQLQNNNGEDCTTSFMAPTMQPFTIKKQGNFNIMGRRGGGGPPQGAAHNNPPPHHQQQSHYNTNYVPNYSPMFQNKQRDGTNPHGVKRQRY